MKILLCCFSATGNTAAVAKVVAEEFRALGAEVEEKDITPLSHRMEGIDPASYDAFVLGSPIHSWRAPRVVRDWLRTLDGGGMRASMFFTFGAFQVHPTHYSTRQILEEQNFVVVSAADFVGAHTFNLGGWRAGVDRPGDSDFAVARDYAQKTYPRLTGADRSVPGEMEKTEHTVEQLDSIEQFRFNVLTKLPTREGEDCSMCMICELGCPTGAMSADKGEAEPGKCITCLACVANCPEGALKINDMSDSWEFKLQMEKESEDEINRKTSRIYL